MTSGVGQHRSAVALKQDKKWSERCLALDAHAGSGATHRLLELAESHHLSRPEITPGELHCTFRSSPESSATRLGDECDKRDEVPGRLQQQGNEGFTTVNTVNDFRVLGYETREMILWEILIWDGPATRQPLPPPTLIQSYPLLK